MNDTCYLCGSKNIKERNGSVRDSKDLRIFECKDCGLVFLSSFEHITQTFYQDSMMFGENNSISVQQLREITKEDDLRRFEQYRNFIKNKSILDFGCGCAGFLSRAKSVTDNCFGLEVDEKYTQYYQDNSLKVFNNISQIEEKFDYIFMFHVLEHIVDPVAQLNQLKNLLKENGKLIIEVPNSQDALLTLYKNQGFSNFTYWSPHLFLYNYKTLASVTSKSGLKPIKIKQFQRYSYSNHLYWLINNKPGGHKKWKYLHSGILNKLYSYVLALFHRCDTIIGVFEDNSN